MKLLLLAVVALTACSGDQGPQRAVTMYFVPSQNPATMRERTAVLERFMAEEAGIELHAEIPTSYDAVVEALASGRADIAWVPPFTYVVAHERVGAEARLQVVRHFELSAVVVAAAAPGRPARLAELAGRRVAVPVDLDPELGRLVRERLDRAARGWIAVAVPDDVAGVRALLEEANPVDGAVSSATFSGPADLVGDGRRRLEAERPGTLQATRVIDRLPEPLVRPATAYRGCFITRTDSGVRRLEDLAGRSIAYTDESSTSGYIFAESALRRAGIRPSARLFVGGHTAVVQAVWARQAAAGAVYYSAAGADQRANGQLVGDARGRAVQWLPREEDKLRYLELVRVIALTDPIPSDVCCVHPDVDDATWRRVADAFQRFLEGPEGRAVFNGLVGGDAATPATDEAFDGFRSTLEATGISATQLMAASRASAGG